MEDKINRENTVVDIVKLFCVFVVAAGHCRFSDVECLRWLPDFVACCVQTLFIFSGYYAAKNGVLESREKIRGYTGHLVCMLVIWMGIYAGYGLYRADKTERAWMYQRLQVVMDELSGLNSGHLWYLEVLIVVVMLFYCLKRTRVSTGQMVVLLIIASFFWTCLNRGLAGVAAGIWLAAKSEDAENTDQKTRKAWLILLTALLAAAMLVVLHYVNLGLPHWLLMAVIYLMADISALCICWLSICCRPGRRGALPAQGGRAGYYIRKISTSVYLSHMLFIQLGIWFSTRYAAWNSGKAWVLCSAFVAMVSTVLGMVLIWLSRKRGFGWIRQLY